jgi:DNA-binding LacI/PurR family transcriptional regulator
LNIKEIARRARVSHSTVSRVINNVETVDRKLARRVRAVIQEVGYRPNHQARSLARGRSRTVGLIVSELNASNPFFSETILYFERAAVKHGYEVLISFADTATPSDHIPRCAARLQERQVEGIAVLTFGMEQSLRGVKISVPMVYAGSDSDLPDIKNVRIDYLPGIREAVKHLVDFGHHRIGYLCGQLNWNSMRTRKDAVRQAIEESGLGLEEELFVECPHTWEGGAIGVSELLKLRDAPTALMCCNDVAAIGAMKILSSRGLQVGRDIALIGFDDLTICKFTQPALNSIQFAPSEIAPLAFRALMDEIEDSKGATVYEYKTKFVLRESTCAPASGRQNKLRTLNLPNAMTDMPLSPDRAFPGESARR